jgi:hypothetical protein
MRLKIAKDEIEEAQDKKGSTIMTASGVPIKITPGGGITVEQKTGAQQLKKTIPAAAAKKPAPRPVKAPPKLNPPAKKTPVPPKLNAATKKSDGPPKLNGGATGTTKAPVANGAAKKPVASSSPRKL